MKGFVDVNRLFGLLACVPCKRLLLRASQVDKLKLADSYIVRLSQILGFYGQAKDRVRAGRHLIKIVTSQHAISRTVIV